MDESEICKDCQWKGLNSLACADEEQVRLCDEHGSGRQPMDETKKEGVESVVPTLNGMLRVKDIMDAAAKGEVKPLPDSIFVVGVDAVFTDSDGVSNIDMTLHEYVLRATNSPAKYVPDEELQVDAQLTASDEYVTGEELQAIKDQHIDAQLTAFNVQLGDKETTIKNMNVAFEEMKNNGEIGNYKFVRIDNDRFVVFDIYYKKPYKTRDGGVCAKFEVMCAYSR